MTTLPALIDRANRNPRDLAPTLSDAGMFADLKASVADRQVRTGDCGCIREAFRNRLGTIELVRELRGMYGPKSYQIRLTGCPGIALVLDAGHFTMVRE